MSRFPLPFDRSRLPRLGLERLRRLGLERLRRLRLPRRPRLPRLPRLPESALARLPRPSLGGLPRPSLGGLPRPPLPLTVAAILLLVLPPLIALSRWPRPRAEGLEKLLSAATLLQSFPPIPDRAPPQLWQERLGGPLAESLWRSQRGSWWQFWGVHSDAAPYLALPARGLLAGRDGRLPPHALRIDDLVVIAPDPLSLRLLQDQLLPRQRRSRGLQGRCVERLRREQSVFWSPQALGVIVGPMAPLLQSFQEGCLALELDPLGLRWQGEAASVEGLLLPLPAALPLADVPLQPPLPPDLLLEIEGDELDTLLQGLLSRQLIREPLSSLYGLDRQRMTLLRRAPFRLRLRPRNEGPFQASLELQLEVGGQHAAWKTLLSQLATQLRRRGLQLAGEPPAPLPAPGAPPKPGPAQAPLPPGAPSTTAAAALPAADWKRQDGVVAGGWRWLQEPSGDAQVLLFLGPPPPRLERIGQSSLRPGRGELRLRARPEAMAALGLLPAEMPPVVQRSQQLWIEAAPLPGMAAGQPVSRLTGRLQVRR